MLNEIIWTICIILWILNIIMNTERGKRLTNLTGIVFIMLGVYFIMGG